MSDVPFGSTPIQPEFHALMNSLAEALDDIFNPDLKPPQQRQVGFVLLSFKMGQTSGGRVNYISNASREDMLAAMREWLARAEGRVPQARGQA